MLDNKPFVENKARIAARSIAVQTEKGSEFDFVSISLFTTGK